MEHITCSYFIGIKEFAYKVKNTVSRLLQFYKEQEGHYDSSVKLRLIHQSMSWGCNFKW